MAVKYTSYDDVYKAYAWRDNRRRLVVTQGEGLSSSSTDSNTYIKTAKFQLRDEQGAIELPNSTTAVSLALKKPNGMEVLVSAFYNYTDSATTKSEDRENGIVYFAITQSMTDIAGEVSGEIRLTTSTGVIKFYGINFYVYDGVSGNAAVQSNDFNHLVNALNKVEAVTGGGTIATLDSVIEHGGLHPVVSGVIYDFVNDNFIKYETINSSTLNNTNTHLDPQTIYRYGSQGLILAANDEDEEAQYYFAQDGSMRYRYRKKVGDTWEQWDSQFIKIETTENKVTSMDSNSTNTQYPTAKAVYDAITGCEQYKNLGDSYVNNSGNHLDGNTVYKYGNGFVVQANGSTSETQYYFASDGKLRYRTRTKTGGVWDDWVDQFHFSVLETQENKTTTLNSSSTDDQYPTAKTVYDYAAMVKNAVPNSVSSLPENSVKLDDATDPRIIYRYFDNGFYRGLIIPAATSSKQSQYYFGEDGIMRYRCRDKVNGTWEEWDSHFTTMETTQNKTTTINSSSTDAQYPTAKAIYDNTIKFATITSTDLFDSDTHLDPQTIYRFGSQGIIIPATNNSNKETQYYFAEDGIMRYRYRVKSGDVWGAWVDDNNFYSIINQEDIGQLLSPQNKLDKYFVKTCIDKTKVRLTQKTRILGFGDSIMNRGYGGSWMDVVQERTGCNIPINKSVGGAQFAVNSGSNTLASQLSSFHNSVNNNTLVDADNHAVDISEINLIVVAGGTNDAYNGIPINNFKTAVDTFFNDLKSEFEDRDMDCPPVLVITPIRRGKESEINAPGNKNLENKIAKYSAVINNLALQYGFSVLNGFDIPVLVDDMTIKGVGSETATISSFMYKTADSGDAYDDILHVHPNPTSGRSTYAQAVINAIGFEPIHSSVFSYTLLRNSWNNSQQSISVPASYVVTGDAIADTEIDNTAYNQLCADGCYGIYVASSTSGNSLILTAHALGNTPTADVTIQVTLTAVNDLSQ